MRRRIGMVLMLAALALAGAAPGAQAKGKLIGARLCGQNGCVAVSAASDLRGLNAAILRIEQQAELTGLVTPHASGYFVVRARPAWTLEGGRAFVIPAAGLLEMNGAWTRLPPALVSRLRGLTGGLMPDTPTGLRVVVGGYAAGGPADARLLLGRLRRVQVQARVWESPLFRVVIRSQPPCPWTDQSPWSDQTAVPMTYAPRYGVVEVGTAVRWFHVPPAVNRRLRAALGLTPARAPAASGGSFQATTVVAACAGLLFAAAGLAFIGLRRRRGRPATA
jgi:hypothetical protein